MTLTAETVLEITSEQAKYHLGDHKNLVGPSAIDIDQNGDIYIGGGKQILVFSNNGRHLRTMTFKGHFYSWIKDIALGLNSELFVLSGSKSIYVIDDSVDLIAF